MGKDRVPMAIPGGVLIDLPSNLGSLLLLGLNGSIG